jgi:sugar phosphate isomerase/epimerase
MPFEVLARKAKEWGYDGLELACWGDHFDTEQALEDDNYCQTRWDILERNGLDCYSISNHLVGQAICDVIIDERHEDMLPPSVWGDGDPKGIRERAAEHMKNAARAAARLGVKVVNGFTGSSIWHLVYSFPPVMPGQIDAGYRDFADRYNPILDVFDEVGVRFALEAHPTEIAFDIVSAERAVAAVDGREAFGFNYDPSHFVYQGVDYVRFIHTFSDRIYHVHMKDARFSETRTEAGMFGGHSDFGDPRRYWDFRSVGRGSVNFELIIRALNNIGYDGPLSIEWEDNGMDREEGCAEACAHVKQVDFSPSALVFDGQFSSG